MLRRLGADVVEVRLPEQLDGLDGLVIPGGESTAIMRLMGLCTGSTRRSAPSPAPIFGTCAGMIVLDRERPRPDRHRRRAQRLRPPGRELRGRPPARGGGRAVPRRLHPRAVDRGRRAGRRDPRRGRRASGAGARGPDPRRGVPSGADRRHADPRALSEPGAGGVACPGIASGRRSSTRRAPPTPSAASSSRSSRARSSSRRRRAGRSRPANLALAERDREGALVLDAEGQHRARDRQGRR